ncbi:MAG: MaoC family dehydratase [Kineosporiaceae bacterium]|nr:MaoC family dehydratase [Kineosporiaceae bacterium]MBK7624137.1 MaoC family dehydratase [Kineosporiaceae bacterium]MBK8075890.1 MaoC family dehydratase [Kineosporiaceae bacterium]
MSERPRFATVQVGDVLPERTFPLQRADLVRYAGASGDFNPIHWNPRVATEVGLPDVIAHGMLTMATAVRLVSDWCGDPGAVLDYGTRFTNPVVVPDDGVGAAVTVTGTVASRDESAQTVRVDLVVVCLGERVLGKAQAVVRLS